MSGRHSGRTSPGLRITALPGTARLLFRLAPRQLNDEIAFAKIELKRKGIRFRVLGRREGIPARVLEAIDRVTEVTAAGTRGTLCLAINYGARAEITDATRWIAREVQSGRLRPDAIDENLISNCLYTAGLPDPDLLIRTAGEMRVSNYLLWQISYAELHVTSVYWPDFGAKELHAAVRDYAGRTRRFGGVEEEERGP